MGCLKLTYYPVLDLVKNEYKKVLTLNKSTLNERSAYLYGFNGMEKDDEVKGKGNSYTTTFRQYDARLGRWLTIDPKMSAWESPYASFGNSPIQYSDPEGDTVRISGKEGQEVIYNDGKAYNPDGSDYAGNDDFINEVVTGLQTLESNSAYASGMIWSLQESEFVTKIMEVGSITEGINKNKDESNNFISDGVKTGDESPRRTRSPKGVKGTGLGAGGIVVWSPIDGIGGLQTDGSTNRPTFISLVHELSHAFDAINASIDRAFGTQMTISKAEIFATHVENIVRADMCLPLRLNYREKKNPSNARLLNGDNATSKFYTQPNGNSYDYYQNSGQIVPFDYQ